MSQCNLDENVLILFSAHALTLCSYFRYYSVLCTPVDGERLIHSIDTRLAKTTHGRIQGWGIQGTFLPPLQSVQLLSPLRLLSDTDILLSKYSVIIYPIPRPPIAPTLAFLIINPSIRKLRCNAASGRGLHAFYINSLPF